MSKVTRVLFVCLGNIVRSPLAENMFSHLTVQAGLGEKYIVDSAGTAGYHVGQTPDGRMVQVAKEYGLIYSGSARQFIRDDFDQFDLIIGMDTSNLSNILSLANGPEDEDKVRLMREFDPEGSPTDPVPDPYYDHGLEGFHKVYRIVERSCQKLLDNIENGEIDL